MAGPATENWWSSFLDAHGRDSEEEAAFDGFLTTNGISAASGPDELQVAYANFVAWMQESEQRQADLGPDRATLAAERAVALDEQRFVAKSRVSAVGVEKPLVAATRPAETRKPLAESGVGPGGEAALSPADGEQPPTRPAVSGEPPPTATPHATTTRVEEPPQPTPEEASESRRGRRSSD